MRGPKPFPRSTPVIASTGTERARSVRWPALSLACCLLVAALALSGCGATTPTEAQVFHDPALRPGVVDAAGPEESNILQRLPESGTDVVSSEDGRLQLGAVYHAASGRRCRTVGITDQPPRLACERQDGAWVFVPLLRLRGL